MVGQRNFDSFFPGSRPSAAVNVQTNVRSAESGKEIAMPRWRAAHETSLKTTACGSCARPSSSARP